MSSNIFPSFSDKSVQYTGNPSDELNIHQGEDLSLTLSKLVVALEALLERVNNCSYCNGESSEISLNADVIQVNAVSSNKNIVTSGRASVKTVPNSTGVGLNVNLNDVINSLGERSQVIRTSIRVEGMKSGYPSMVVDSDKSQISVNLQPDNFPAKVATEIRYMDSEGEKTIALDLPILASGSNYQVPMQGASVGSQPVSNQEELNNSILDRLRTIENQISGISKPGIINNDLPDNATINETLGYIISKL